MITTREAPLTETGPAGQAFPPFPGLRGRYCHSLHAISFPPPSLPFFSSSFPSFLLLPSFSLPPSLLSLFFLSLSPPKVFLTSGASCQRNQSLLVFTLPLNSWRFRQGSQFWVTVFPSIKLKGCIFHLSVSFQNPVVYASINIDANTKHLQGWARKVYSTQLRSELETLGHQEGAATGPSDYCYTKTHQGPKEGCPWELDLPVGHPKRRIGSLHPDG